MTIPQSVIDDVVAKLADSGSLVDTILGALTDDQKDAIIDAFKEKLENDADFRNDMLDALEDELVAEYNTKFENLKAQLENDGI